MVARSVRRRKVLYIAGYDPGAAAGFYRRFLRQLDIFKRTWNVQSVCTDRSISEKSSNWSVTTSGPHWSVQTDFELFSWDDLIAKEATGSVLLRFGRGAAAYADLIGSGTLCRYFKANPRYFVFAVAPLFQFAALLILSFVAGFAASAIASGPWSLIAGAGVAVVSFVVLQNWLGHRWRLHQALDDWIMSLGYIHGRRDDLKARITKFAELISNAANDSSADEILIVGHSLGATFAADALSQAVDITRREISFATLGATIPKCALHPDALWLRKRIASLTQIPTLCWVEIQTRADFISFFRVHPVTLRRVADSDQLPGANPIIRRVKLREMLEPATFAKIRWRPLRLHYQCVSANERKVLYDFFMMICGPAPVALWSKSKHGVRIVDNGGDLSGPAP